MSARSIGLIGCVCVALSACQKAEEAPRDYGLLATDIHISVAGYQMVLPFIALNDYGAKQSFSLDRRQAAANQDDATGKLVREAGDPDQPKLFDRISIEIQTYGSDDWDIERHVREAGSRTWLISALALVHQAAVIKAVFVLLVHGDDFGAGQ